MLNGHYPLTVLSMNDVCLSFVRTQEVNQKIRKIDHQNWLYARASVVYTGLRSVYFGFKEFTHDLV